MTLCCHGNLLLIKNFVLAHLNQIWTQFWPHEPLFGPKTWLPTFRIGWHKVLCTQAARKCHKTKHNLTECDNMLLGIWFLSTNLTLILTLFGHLGPLLGPEIWFSIIFILWHWVSSTQTINKCHQTRTTQPKLEQKLSPAVWYYSQYSLSILPSKRSTASP